MKASLASRAIDYFQRQLAAYELMLRELDGCRGGAWKKNVQGLLEMQARHTETNGNLVAEYKSLRTELRNQPELLNEQSELGQLAKRAQALTARLESVQRELLAEVDEEKDLVKSQLAGVRRERGILRKYAPDVNADPGFIDKKR